jgi:hypothetical protein
MQLLLVAALSTPEFVTWFPCQTETLYKFQIRAAQLMEFLEVYTFLEKENKEKFLGSSSLNQRSSIWTIWLLVSLFIELM